MNKKLSIIFLLGIFMFSFASADLGTFKQNDCVQIKTILNTTTVTLSTISYPNSTMLILDEAMTKNGLTFNYSFCSIDLIGEYIYDYYDFEGNVYVNTFQITKTGKEFKQSEAIIYFILILGLIIFLIISTYGAIALPYKNQRNDRGGIIGVNDLKYLKILSIFLSYGILTWLANIMITVSNNYIDIGVALGFFTIMFKLMIFLLYPVLIFTIIFIVIELVSDFKINKLLDRGLSA